MITLVLSNDFGRNCSTRRRKSFDETSEVIRKSDKIIERQVKTMRFSIFVTRKSLIRVVAFFGSGYESLSC